MMFLFEKKSLYKVGMKKKFIENISLMNLNNPNLSIFTAKKGVGEHD